jgi:hypothetical protein
MYAPKKSLSMQMRNEATMMRSYYIAKNLPKINETSHEIKIEHPPDRQRDTFARLSGVNDPSNTSGLYGERKHSIFPTSVCVRCGQHASICMSCCDSMCENTLTFYRKTKAAGAAELFTKAFVEAGSSKLVKFFVFRLLKNSFEIRKRKQMKMKNVVERLFGANVVFLPFSAWKRYTRENILRRKDKMISQLTERLQAMEMQQNKSLATIRNQDQEVEQPPPLLTMYFLSVSLSFFYFYFNFLLFFLVVYLFICLFLCLFVFYLFICLFVCLFICLFVCLFYLLFFCRLFSLFVCRLIR